MKKGSFYQNSLEKGQNLIRINYFYAIALVISLIFLISGVIFIQYASRLSRADTIGYIEEATKQTKFAIEEHIDEEFHTLMAAAVLAQDKDLLDDGEVLRTLIDSLGAHNAYIRIGFANTAGQAVWIDQYGRASG